MTSQTGNTRRGITLRRVARIVSTACYAGFLVWITWLAVTRWNGVPADPSGGALGFAAFSPPIDPDLDRTEELTAALAAMPTPPALVLPPPPPGMKWGTPPSTTVVLDDVTNGEWTPETRPNLHNAIRFMQSPAFDASMERLAAIAPGEWRPMGPRGPGLAGARPMIRTLLARARYHHAEVGDIDAALDDFAVLFRIMSMTSDSGSLVGVVVAQGYGATANVELAHLARERTLEPSHAIRIIEMLSASPSDGNDLWEAWVDGLCGQLERSVNLSFTSDGKGDGWLVLSYAENLALTALATERRSGAWNILSPLFNSRQTLSDKIDRLRSGYEAALHLPFREAVRILNNVPNEFGVADGPLVASTDAPFPVLMYQGTVKRLARRNATMVAVALSAYRFDHAVYPTSLQELDGIYLPVPALDPYIDGPFCYERRDDGYILYSVGPNLVDDGGQKHSRESRSWGKTPDGDWLYTEPRSKPRSEPTLEEM